MTRIAFLHIGHPKTATSYLQHAIHLNADKLFAVGVDVPSQFAADGYWDFSALSRQRWVHSGNASPLFLALQSQDNARFDQLIGKFDSDWDVVLSSELLFFYPGYVERIATALKQMGYFVHVIAYIGTYASMAVQCYCQIVRNGGFWDSFEAYLRDPPDRYLLRYAALYSRLCAMASVDRISLRPFAPEFLVRGDVVDDFFATVAPTLNRQGLVRPEGSVNQRLPLLTLEALRIVNRVSDREAIARLRDSRAVATTDERKLIQDFYFSGPAGLILRDVYGEDRRQFLARMQPRFRPFWASDPEVGRAVGPPQELVDKMVEWARGREGPPPEWSP